ncbi:unnamed protein product [Psylliodes chrysocephalus]|uniref:Uncharacterized protein n=1 Tax=Psylliodes chrysocephalus TaxID=3402493 RepID=A0A9P0G5U9_9CUCU|nr:unnamed protein product [Psylliodes chrysocephala]
MSFKDNDLVTNFRIRITKFSTVLAWILEILILHKKGVGTNKKGVGTNKKGVGTNKKGVGTNKKGVGTNKKGVGTNKKGVGTNKKGVGTNKKGVGTNKKGVGTNKKGVGTNKRLWKPKKKTNVSLNKNLPSRNRFSAAQVNGLQMSN